MRLLGRKWRTRLFWTTAYATLGCVCDARLRGAELASVTTRLGASSERHVERSYWQRLIIDSTSRPVKPRRKPAG